jgi:hypothetical protein
VNHDWQTDVRSYERTAATFLPPATVEETGWDLLLALHSDRYCDVSLQKLACVISVPEAVMKGWLATLEQRELITGAKHRSTGELLAMLTAKGRDLLDRYFSAASDLQVGAHH